MDQTCLFEASPTRDSELLQTLFWTKIFFWMAASLLLQTLFLIYFTKRYKDALKAFPINLQGLFSS